MGWREACLGKHSRDDAAHFPPSQQFHGGRPALLTSLIKEYLPFNGGPRACLGQQYAITETLYIITRFVQEFRSIEARDNLPWTETLGLTVAPAHVRVCLCRKS